MVTTTRSPPGARNPVATFNLDILPPSQRNLWDVLGHTPPDFVLYGGTALALRLGHRQSVDFDFFSRSAFLPDELQRQVAYLTPGRAIQKSENTLTCAVDLDGEVLISFFGGLDIGSVEDPDPADGPGIHVASLLDLAATKAAVVQARPSAKDYIDLNALLLAGVSMAEALGAARAVYGVGFNPLLTLKALTFFGEGDLSKVPLETRQNLAAAVTAVDLECLPSFQSRPRLVPAPGG